MQDGLDCLEFIEHLQSKNTECWVYDWTAKEEPFKKPLLKDILVLHKKLHVNQERLENPFS